MRRVEIGHQVFNPGILRVLFGKGGCIICRLKLARLIVYKHVIAIPIGKRRVDSTVDDARWHHSWIWLGGKRLMPICVSRRVWSLQGQQKGINVFGVGMHLNTIRWDMVGRCVSLWSDGRILKDFWRWHFWVSVAVSRNRIQSRAFVRIRCWRMHGSRVRCSVPFRVWEGCHHRQGRRCGAMGRRMRKNRRIKFVEIDDEIGMVYRGMGRSRRWWRRWRNRFQRSQRREGHGIGDVRLGEGGRRKHGTRGCVSVIGM